MHPASKKQKKKKNQKKKKKKKHLDKKMLRRFRFNFNTLLNNNNHNFIKYFSSNTNFPGAPNSEYTNELNLKTDYVKRDVFHILDNNGDIVSLDKFNEYYPKDDAETWLKMYKSMVTINTLDNIFYDAQRQGRISFYMTSFGEEAAAIGSASALDFNDIIFPQYREQGALYWRGFTLEMFAEQCFSTSKDLGKGRQMPIHYGSYDLNVHTVSSPLATQIPHSVGAAYALKRQENNQNITLNYFGEGAASEGDFHTAMNFSSTLNCPVIFFVEIMVMLYQHHQMNNIKVMV